MIRVELPNVFCSYPNATPTVVVDASCRTVGEALSAVGEQSPGALDRIMDERGDVRRHVNVFVNGENIRFLTGLDTPVAKDSTILVIAAVSGG